MADDRGARGVSDGVAAPLWCLVTVALVFALVLGDGSVPVWHVATVVGAGAMTVWHGRRWYRGARRSGYSGKD